MRADLDQLAAAELVELVGLRSRAARRRSCWRRRSPACRRTAAGWPTSSSSGHDAGPRIDDEQDDVGRIRGPSRSAPRSAWSGCRRPRMPMPPVSTSSKNRPLCSIKCVTRSRVTPAWSSTIEIRRPASQLNRLDLPTLGRPTMTTCGTDMGGWQTAGASASEGKRHAGQVVSYPWHNLLSAGVPRRSIDARERDGLARRGDTDCHRYILARHCKVRDAGSWTTAKPHCSTARRIARSSASNRCTAPASSRLAAVGQASRLPEHPATDRATSAVQPPPLRMPLTTPHTPRTALRPPPAPRPAPCPRSPPALPHRPARRRSPTAKTSSTTLNTEVRACTLCRDLACTRKQTVFGVGNAKPRVVFFGEAPGADEDRQGEPFVGRAGQLLTKIIEACGWQRSDVYIMNVLKCRPPENRNPLPARNRQLPPFLRAAVRDPPPRIHRLRRHRPRPGPARNRPKPSASSAAASTATATAKSSSPTTRRTCCAIPPPKNTSGTTCRCCSKRWACPFPNGSTEFPTRPLRWCLGLVVLVTRAQAPLWVPGAKAYSPCPSEGRGTNKPSPKLDAPSFFPTFCAYFAATPSRPTPSAASPTRAHLGNMSNMSACLRAAFRSTSVKTGVKVWAAAAEPELRVDVARLTHPQPD